MGSIRRTLKEVRERETENRGNKETDTWINKEVLPLF